MAISNNSTRTLQSTMKHLKTRCLKGLVETDTQEPGVFVSTRSLKVDLADCPFPSSHTVLTTASSTPPSSWKSCDKLDYHRGAPLIVSSPESGKSIEDEAAELGNVLAKSRRLPSTAWFASNHVMVNNERTSHAVAPLTRLSELDAIARDHAEAMASQGRLFHSNPQQIRSSFSRTSRRFGENVARGSGIREMHDAMMKNLSDRNNILDRRYCNFGMATCRGDDGRLYMAQVFRG